MDEYWSLVNDVTLWCDAPDLLAARFHALADPTRLRILNTLMRDENSVGELVAGSRAFRGISSCCGARASSCVERLSDNLDALAAAQLWKDEGI